MSGLQTITKRRIASLNIFDFAWMLATSSLCFPLAFSWAWLVAIVVVTFIGSAISVRLETIAGRP